MEATSPPQKPQQDSLHYSMYNRNYQRNMLNVTWGRNDHAELLAVFEKAEKESRGHLLKDWVIASDEFMRRAPQVITEIILDHDRIYGTKGSTERDDFKDNRIIKDFEMQLDISDREAGIFNSHVLMIVINRLTTLQRKLQADIIRRGKRTLENINKGIGDLYRELDRM